MPRTGSITPTTLRKFSPIQVEISQATTERTDLEKSTLLLQSKYQAFEQYRASTTLQDTIEGVIDASKLARSKAELQEFDNEFKYKIARLETYKNLITEYEKFLSTNQGLNLYCNDSYANSTTSVFRFGIDAEHLSTTQSKELAAIYDKTVAKGSTVSSKGKKAQALPHMLHPMEVLQIKEAIKFSITNSHKAVLVDIFERNDDGSIVISPKDDKPGTHTIVLYIQQEHAQNQVLVIDPSNSDFSKHIIYNNDIIFGYDNHSQILVSPTPLKVYAPPAAAPVGPAPHQFRNCTDIAVKLALGLNKHVGNIDIAKLSELDVIQEITNQSSINQSLFFDSQNIPVRIRQASEDNVREKTCALTTSIDKQSQCAKLYKYKELANKMLVDSASIFEVECAYDQYSRHLDELSRIHHSNIALIGEMMEDAIS